MSTTSQDARRMFALLGSPLADRPELPHMPRLNFWGGNRPQDSRRTPTAKRRSINRYQERAGKVEACRS